MQGVAAVGRAWLGVLQELEVRALVGAHSAQHVPFSGVKRCLLLLGEQYVSLKASTLWGTVPPLKASTLGGTASPHFRKTSASGGTVLPGEEPHRSSKIKPLATSATKALSPIGDGLGFEGVS